MRHMRLDDGVFLMGIEARVSEAQASVMHLEYKDGLTLDQVGAKHGVSGHLLQSTFHRLGLPCRGRGTVPRAEVQKVDDSEIVAFKRWWDGLDTSVKGSIAEGYVRVRLMELSLDVWEPCAQNHKTDFIVVSGDKMLRIQVKCATYDEDRKRFRANLHRRTRGGKHSLYEADEVDFFIVLCLGLERPDFYVIPATEIGRQPSINLLPHRRRMTVFREFSWEQFRDAFSLMGGIYAH